MIGSAIHTLREHSLAFLVSAMVLTLSVGLLVSGPPPARTGGPIVIVSPSVSVLVLPRATDAIRVEVPRPGVTVRTTVRSTVRATATATATVTVRPRPTCTPNPSGKCR